MFDAAAPAPPTASPAQSVRVAIVTAYHGEDRGLLERCVRSVSRQTVRADHILVADGLPQDWLDDAGVRHIRLDRVHDDRGATPLGVGALLAIAEDYDALGFLDAANWLEPDHVDLGLRTAWAGPVPCDYVLARRSLRRLDGTRIDLKDDPVDQPADTNCIVFLAGAFHAVMRFCLIPQPLSAIADQLFQAHLKAQTLAYAVVAKPTVNRTCFETSVYRALGEVAPPNARADLDEAPLKAWLATLSPEQRLIVSRRTGLDLPSPVPTTEPAPLASPASLTIAPAPTVQSFDVFDTLIARRCVDAWRIFQEVGERGGRPDFVERRREAERAVSADNYTLDDIYDRLAQHYDLSPDERDDLKNLELAREIDNVIPIAENLARVSHGDVLISDMYLGPSAIRELLDKAGLRRQVSLHVEAHGKSAGHIWPMLRAQCRIARHTGDNPHSDGAMPRRFAIATELTTAANFNPVEQALAEAGVRDLALLCREARLATWHDDPHIRELQLVQTSLNLPLLLLASICLARLAVKLDKTTVSFCSRDCNLWLPMFDAVQSRMGLSLDARYFLTSRLARTQGSSAYLEYAREFMHPGCLLVDVCGTGWSMAHLAQRAGLVRSDLFLLDYLPPFEIYERSRRRPDTCRIHHLFDTPRVGDNMVLEAANLADHVLVLDMRQVGPTFTPIFQERSETALEQAAIGAQRDAFLKSIGLMGGYGLGDVLELDDPSLQLLCSVLYGFMSRQARAFDILAPTYLAENDAVLKALVA